MKAKFGKSVSMLLAGVSIFSAAALMPNSAMADHRRGGGSANDRNWATAGKILTGVVAVDLLANHIFAPCRERVVYAPAPVVYAPAPVVYAPPPAVVYAPVPQPMPRVWHEGHYEIVQEKVWVDTSYEVEEWQQGYRRADGAWVEAHKIRRVVPSGYWKVVERQVWVEGRYE